MKITDLISITELSRLTNKSRPTIYKYISDYVQRKYDEIPYSFIVLFGMTENENVSRQEIIQYCNTTYGGISIKSDKELLELVDLLIENRGRLNLSKIRMFVERELK